MPTTVAGTSITYNDSTAQSTAYIGGRSTIYTSGTNTFTVPTGVTALKVTVIGGGGGGGGARAIACSTGAGGGGGGAGMAIRWITGLTPGSTITATVGAGGTAGASTPTAGGSGGTSSFGAYASATGGSGGAAGNETSGTAGGHGTGSSGNINLPGSRPFSGNSTNGGQANIYSLGGITQVYSTQVGPSPSGYGAGGGGATCFPTSQLAGAAGASGIIIIEY